MNRIFLLALALAMAVHGHSQNSIGHLDYGAEMQVSASNGTTPLWLNANKHGLSSLQKANGYLDGELNYQWRNDSSQWDIKAGLEAAVAHNYTSGLILQQAYVEGRWLKGKILIGAKERDMAIHNPRLSTGAQTLGINSRPVPMVSIGLDNYVNIWKWLGVKGHIAFGWMTDDKWQKQFTNDTPIYNEDAKWHEKAGYIRFGREDKPLTVEAGLEMATIFGEKAHMTNGKIQDNSPKLKNYWKVFWAAGGDSGEGEFANAEGNIVGSWLLRVNWNQPSYKVSLYADHFFDDHSQMFLLDYDGYEGGENWKTRQNSSYLAYPLKDIMLGTEITLKDFQWVKGIVLEYMYTKYQSGPIYHDHGTIVKYHVGGNDDYYNHGRDPYQHWGQGIGNPLYRSPIYNDDGKLVFQNNRFVAWHIGLEGQPLPKLSYRLLATIQTGWGTYSLPYKQKKRHNGSVMGEVNYAFDNGWSATGALGLDHGTILGNNFGTQLTIRKTGRIF
jgi:hypothetical protein